MQQVLTILAECTLVGLHSCSLLIYFIFNSYTVHLPSLYSCFISPSVLKLYQLEVSCAMRVARFVKSDTFDAGILCGSELAEADRELSQAEFWWEPYRYMPAVRTCMYNNYCSRGGCSSASTRTVELGHVLWDGAVGSQVSQLASTIAS